MPRRLRSTGMPQTGGLIAAALAAVSTAVCAAPDIRAIDLDGHPRSFAQLAGRPTVMILVRSDCGPCQLELRNIEAIKAAAGPARLVLLAVEDRDGARRVLRRAPLPHADLWAANVAPNAVLVKLNGAPPRLPLAIALDRAGAICARHLGLLGTDRIHDWVKRCS